ncbi:unnamed protein product [Zymoseptoria tritici ST99CH_1E4]|uniref:Uncharacterized protein n=1 Tax=Zymoseptoria tritici ST99CH_1E4 TaxID=1276532 RepID=A0A2H1GJD8_ZYMTR|nr:unnamed protein product [Zymoseptoria tritici ST99CH_1E4]
MRGTTILAISSFLSGVSAICMLPMSASTTNPNRQQLLSTPYPPATANEQDYGAHVCKVYSNSRTGGINLHWRCVYAPETKTTNCQNDWWVAADDYDYPFLPLTGCHHDTKDGDKEHGFWACVYDGRSPY